MSLGVEISNYCLNSPVSVVVKDIATITILEKLGIVLLARWPWFFMRPNSNHWKKFSRTNDCGSIDFHGCTLNLRGWQYQ
jgi:hypothetical protein